MPSDPFGRLFGLLRTSRFFPEEDDDLEKQTRYIIGAPPPFGAEQAPALRERMAEVVSALFPGCADEYARRGGRRYEALDRVYDCAKAQRELRGRVLKLELKFLDASKRS